MVVLTKPPIVAFKTIVAKAKLSFTVTLQHVFAQPLVPQGCGVTREDNPSAQAPARNTPGPSRSRPRVGRVSAPTPLTSPLV